jgi:hypothetical protein
MPKTQKRDNMLCDNAANLDRKYMVESCQTNLKDTVFVLKL